MSEDVKQEKKYTIELIDNGEVKGKVVKAASGEPLFGVSDGFSDAQIDEVFNLCNDYFNQGMKLGIQRMQADALNMLGISQEALRTLYEITEERKPVEDEVE